MNNVDLQTLITTYGNRIFAIVLDNNKRILIGYQSSSKLADISLVTISSVDFIKVNNKKRSNQIEIEYFTLYITDCIQSIGIMEDGFEKYGVDPLLFI